MDQFRVALAAVTLAGQVAGCASPPTLTAGEELELERLVVTINPDTVRGCKRLGSVSVDRKWVGSSFAEDHLKRKAVLARANTLGQEIAA